MRKKSPPKQYRFHPKIPGETLKSEPLLGRNNSAAQKSFTAQYLDSVPRSKINASIAHG
jgi:hypothetical protein